MKAIVWTRTNCYYCNTVKELLDLKGIEIEERNLDEGLWTKEQLRELLPEATSLPQVFIDETHIGGVPNVRMFINVNEFPDTRSPNQVSGLLGRDRVDEADIDYNVDQPYEPVPIPTPADVKE